MKKTDKPFEFDYESGKKQSSCTAQNRQTIIRERRRIGSVI